MRSDFITCPACNTREGLDLVIGQCFECGYEQEGFRDEPGCPRCFNSTIYDAEAQVCYNCGYEAPESAYEPIPTADGEELLSAVDLVESYEIARKTENIVSVNQMTPAEWAENAMNTKKYTYKPEPYQPFFDLIEDLKAWKVTVRKTSDTGRLHTWVNKMGKKSAGVDVTHMAKAFGPYVWIPESQWGTKSGYLSLVHEGTHAKDFWKFGTILFFLMQNLLPFGPSFTALFEYRAYVAGLKAEKKVYGSLLPKSTEQIANVLASRGYRYCFPWPKVMLKLLNRAVDE